MKVTHMQHAAKSQPEVAMRNPIQCNQCSMQSICVPAGLVSSDVELPTKVVASPISTINGDGL